MIDDDFTRALHHGWLPGVGKLQGGNVLWIGSAAPGTAIVLLRGPAAAVLGASGTLARQVTSERQVRNDMELGAGRLADLQRGHEAEPAQSYCK